MAFLSFRQGCMHGIMICCYFDTDLDYDDDDDPIAAGMV